MTVTNEDTGDFGHCVQLRQFAGNLPSNDTVMNLVMKEEQRLGLPVDWVSGLPDEKALPGDYTRAEYGLDAALTWKAQEFMARTGRLGECDAMLVAEALEYSSVADGKKSLHEFLSEILFILTWPNRTYGLHTRLDFCCDVLIDLLEGSPSVLLHADLDRCWQSALYKVSMLDGELQLPEQNPWLSLADVLRAAADRLEKGSRMELRRVLGEPLPDKYRSFLD
jgi:hypothetical protein